MSLRTASGEVVPLPVSGRIILSDNLPVLQAMRAESVDLIYVDPPFNTGRIQSRTASGSLGTPTGIAQASTGPATERRSSAGAASTTVMRTTWASLRPVSARPAGFSNRGSFFLHIDYREAHYCKVLLDEIFGRASFMNEIIWAYGYGARSKRKWSAALAARERCVLWPCRA